MHLKSFTVVLALLCWSPVAAHADVCGVGMSVVVGPPALVPAIVTSIGAGVADYNEGWQVAAFVAGGLAVVGGGFIVGLGVKIGSDSCFPMSMEIAVGSMIMSVGALSIGMGLLNRSRPQASGPSVRYMPLLDLKTGTVGVLLGGVF